MVDDAAPDAAPAICPWCSATLPVAPTTNCPSCGATLVSDAEPQLPGVTAIDAEAIVRGTRSTAPRQRSRLLSWISGEYESGEPDSVAAPGSLGLPPPEVRREMLRLELEAEVANLQAEVDAMTVEAELEAEGTGDGDDDVVAAPPSEASVGAAETPEPIATEADRTT